MSTDLCWFGLVFLYVLASFHDGRHRIAQSLVSDEESLGGTELQEHVEAHRYVVGVVADVEAHNLLVLAFLKLHV